MRRLLEAMRAEDVTVPVFCGGVIPEEDAAVLRKMGVAAVIPPGTLTADLLRIVGGALGQAAPATGA
jgi:methylmalonyl-CoA mutase C-terminal domain/subunit